jgi:tetratricopeptide (TPR) repeat protein
VPFRWSLNPYRGCQHACAYCYARPTHQYLGYGAGTDFDTRIVVKTNAAELLRKALSQRAWKFESIAFSGVTDCYQPLEASYGITRACLEVCEEFAQPVGLITKGALVRRDIDVLARLKKRAQVRVFLSIPFAHDAIGRAMEPWGRHAEAEPYYVEALEGFRRVQGEEGLETLTAMHEMAMFLHGSGRNEEAEPYARDALERRRRLLGSDHVRTQASVTNLGHVLRDQGKLTEAELLFEEALATTRRVLGEDHPYSMLSLLNLVDLLKSQGRLADAEALHWEVLDADLRLLGLESDVTQQVADGLHDILTELSAAARRAADDEALGLTLARLGSMHLLLENYIQAEPVLEEAFGLLVGVLAEDDPRLWPVCSDLGAAIAGQERLSDAQPLLLEAAEAMAAGAPSATPARFGETQLETAVQRVIEVFEALEATEAGAGHGDNARTWRARLEAQGGEADLED